MSDTRGEINSRYYHGLKKKGSARRAYVISLQDADLFASLARASREGVLRDVVKKTFLTKGEQG